MGKFINNLAYEASAGSGKTFMLVVRYLSLLFKGAESSKILALTFTNKAANEMQERIILTLEELENRDELDVISEITGFSKGYLVENRKIILDKFLNSNTKIMTIDKFFAQILRKFSLYASLMPDFSTFSSQHELKLLARFLKEVSVAGKRETLIKLSLDSKKRLNDIFSLLDDFYTKKYELSQIKFEKQEQWRYAEEALENLRFLKEIVDKCDKASNTVKNSVDAKNIDELVKKSWIEKESLNYRTFSKCFTPEMDIYLVKIQESLKLYFKAKEQNFFYGLVELLTIYEKSKKALYSDDSELSFNDVTVLVYFILKERIDSEFLYFRLDSVIEHILLDEFQDTSILQYEILKPLIEEIIAGEGVFNDGSFFFVGDIKQSIYRFRGGVSALFGEVKDECGTKVEKLLTNFRSQKEVIEFVNGVFIDKIKNYTPQLVRDNAQDGYVEVIESDEIIEEAIKQVKMLIELGADLDNIAILCATNGDGESMKEELLLENIEVVTETTTKLISQRSVKAVLEYLKYQYFKEDIYLHNFFSLIEQDYRVIKKVDFTNYKLLDIVKNMINEFGLFHDDFHLIRFLDTLSNFQDIESLLFEYERIDTSAAASDLSGVRVLTIHKSKGLEYKHVIVIDRLKRAPSSSDSIIYEYDGIKLENIYLRTKGREGLDKAYANALEKEKQLVREDSLNALYVAFTRAKENLFIIKKSKSSSFEMLDISKNVYGKFKPIEKDVSNLVDSSKLDKFEYKEFYYGTQSDILALEDSVDEELKSVNFGLAMHYMLEMLDSFSIKSIATSSHMMMNKFGSILEDSEVDEIQKRVSNLLESKEFLGLTDGVCYKEKAIRHNNNLRYIDLLVKKGDSWSVIDYKSSAKFSNHHHKQVSYYVKAIEDITGDEVDGYICYLLEDEVKMVKI